MKTVHAVSKLTLLGIFLLAGGCSTGLQPVCRHTSLMCALVMQERYRDVRISFGPAMNANGESDPLVSHAQAKVLVDGKWTWVNYAGGACQLTDIKENFLDLNSYPPDMFYAWLWKSSPATNTPPPAMNFSNSVSIAETGRFR
ncbi:MAG: hypothetical protein A4E73_01643 [Syntrophaceae bacterium PtaU1.Bin231]|nr:MAG: hypothetical protein A4E73_01643 [Syntrophaceae bacterium PtaU1.Bin231]HOG18616.1 hypothetical protein [Syntrophales bacterium]